jgi:RND family efflux transporter MFP subunit
MIKKNILGITMIILIIGAFAAGYFVGKGSGQALGTQLGNPVQSGQAWAGQPSAEQSERLPQSETNTPDKGTTMTPQPQEAQLEDPQTEAPTSKETQTETSQMVTSQSIGHTFYGTVVPYEEANVQSKQGGTITMLKGKEGDAVRKGEVLVRFDNSDTQLELEKAQSSKNSALQQVQQAESNFNTVQANFDRTQKLFDDGLVSKQELDDITNQLESARSSLNSAKESVTQAETQIKILQNSLKDFQISTPISGIIETKNYNVQEVYKASDVIYHLINIDQVYVEVEVPETYLQKIREGMEVSVVFDALGDQKFSGVVDTILPSGAADNRSFTAKVLVQNSKHAIKSGMFARVEIKLDDSML